jgi:hypothetical protein
MRSSWWSSLKGMPRARSDGHARWGWHLLLALVMLWMQQAGLRHALQHIGRNDTAPAHTACLECLAHHAQDHGAAPTVPVLATVSAEHVLTPDQGEAQRTAEAPRVYWSRAPPAAAA